MPLLYPNRVVAASVLLCALMAQGANSVEMPAQLTADTPLRPNPGAAGRASLAGIDVNGNGVRDDLEPFLVQQFGKNVRLLRAMSNIVISLQAAIDADTLQKSRRAHSMMIISSECLAASGEDVLSLQKKMEELIEMVIDTPERNSAMEAHQSRIEDQLFMMRNSISWEAYCENRADLINLDVPYQPRRE